jgi:hypothetical protein
VKVKLLLDAHLSPKVATALKRRFPDLDVKSIHDTNWAARQPYPHVAGQKFGRPAGCQPATRPTTTRRDRSSARRW